MAFGCAGLALPLQFTFLDWPVLILDPFMHSLVMKIWDSSLVMLVADLLVDPPFGF